MNDPVGYLDLDDLIDVARTLLGDPPPIRDVGLLGSAAARPQASAFGHDAYPDVITKAAALLQSIVDNDALVDGSKRLGWLATAVFLELNVQRVQDLQRRHLRTRHLDRIDQPVPRRHHHPTLTTPRTSPSTLTPPRSIGRPGPPHGLRRWSSTRTPPKRTGGEITSRTETTARQNRRHAPLPVQQGDDDGW